MNLIKVLESPALALLFSSSNYYMKVSIENKRNMMKFIILVGLKSCQEMEGDFRVIRGINY